MKTYTIYKHPSDFPNHYVMRVFRIMPSNPVPTGEFAIANTLEEIRALIPLGLARFNRDPSDDPTIVETWL